MKICFLAIGNELLKGRIVNTNLTKAGEILRTNGYDLTRGLTIQDDKESILAALEKELAENDVIIMSGGLGPTTDDITKKTIAAYFGVGMKEDTTTVELLTQFFAQRNIPLSDRNRAQAMVPENCEVMLNLRGTAPGMYFSVGEKKLFSLPGVPFEMLYLLENKILPILKQSFPLKHYQNHIFRLWGIPESSLADRIAEIEDRFPPELDLSYLPRIDGIWLECTIRGNAEDKAALSEKLAYWTGEIRAILADKCYTEGRQSLEQEVLTIFTERKLTLAIAESMTGGQIAGKLVTVSGASSYLKGGVTAYFTEIKEKVLNVPAEIIEKEGVVSAEVAMKMAEGVRTLLGADIGISTTGYADKSGEDILPHVWTGYADAHRSNSRRFDFFNTREINIERGVSAALVFLLNQLAVK
jgi:nicotinamide-nucleotide amidase